MTPRISRALLIGLILAMPFAPWCSRLAWAPPPIDMPSAGQNPSPMVEHAREHPRLPRATPAGTRHKLSLGTLFIPEKLAGRKKFPLFIHFHGATWLAEVAAAHDGRWAAIAVNVGSGSAAYAGPFRDSQAFGRLLSSAEAAAGVSFDPIGLTAWSAGYGAIREILKTKEYYDRVQFVLLLDGLHAGYLNGRPGPRESTLTTKDLEVFVRYARDAKAKKKQFIVTHSEIFPGTFASTTETADYLLQQLDLKRRPVLQWGPMRTQQISAAGQGDFRVLGYAGNSAPDHVDLLHALPDFLGMIRLEKPAERQ